MSTSWERKQDKLAKAKKARDRYKRPADADEPEGGKTWILDVAPEQAQAGILTAIHRNTVEAMVGPSIVEAKLPSNASAQGVLDFVVGDRVWLDMSDATRVTVLGREERTSFVGRTRNDGARFSSSEWHVLAANVDIGVITVALKNPDLNAQFIDRYLILLQDGGVQPVICISKADLSSERPSILDFYKKINIPIIETSSALGKGIDELKNMLTGKVAVFIGQSGVGKSSLIKAMDPSLDIATQTVSVRTGEGRHTTTRSNLYQWAENSFIIDTPGIRSLGVDVIQKDQIRFLFPEFTELATGCKYHDCLHMVEPGCAIKRSLEGVNSVIDARRYESYVRMMEE